MDEVLFGRRQMAKNVIGKLSLVLLGITGDQRILSVDAIRMSRGNPELQNF
jgi:hypothetical protein